MHFDGLILDGAMGSQLLERSGVFAPSEQFVLTHPDLVKQIHLDYIAAGSTAVFADTFGINPLRYDDYADLVDKAIDIALSAREASGKDVKIGLDVGPTGKIVGKAGISFDEAYRAFADLIAAARDRTDFIVLETFTDLNEMRAAILAAKDNTRLPIAASMSFEKNGRSAFGCTPESFALTATALGVDAVGLNCSVGPAEMLRLHAELQTNTHLPTFVKPNAGMPTIYKGRSIYNVTADTFAANMANLRANGACALGGCCGTTPAYIAAMCRAIEGVSKATTTPTYAGKLCSAARATTPTGGAIIGERINPTGKKLLQAALRAGDLDYVVALGPKQEEEGAQMLDVNLGLSGMDDATYMQEVVDRLQSITVLPLVIDSANPKTIELGLRYFAGRALVNSVNGNDASLDAVLPLVRRYGAAVIGLCLDEKGIPDTVEGRVDIARKILARALAAGLHPEDVYIDCLTMAEGAQVGSARLTIQCLRRVKRLGCRTVLGVSNISYGMPHREDLNAAFFAMAKEAGLDVAIYNPALAHIEPSKEARAYLEGAIDAEAYVRYAQNVVVAPQEEVRESIEVAVRRGDAKAVGTIVKDMLSKGEDAAKALVRALDTVGALYEQGKYFLPQLIAAADAAKVGFDMLYSRADNVREAKGKMVLATVKGDVHDIGKNIVKAVVSNYGYQVIDLGKDVSAQRILDSLGEHMPCVLGLSALMTTTAVNMADIVCEVRKVYPTLPILVGGAVITPQFAQDMGCTYCKDAAMSVRELGKIYK